MNRISDNGRVYNPEERVDRVQALKMATIWAAEYVLREDVLGSLEPGKWADFLVLDKPFFDRDANAWYWVPPWAAGEDAATALARFERDTARLRLQDLRYP